MMMMNMYIDDETMLMNVDVENIDVYVIDLYVYAIALW